MIIKTFEMRSAFIWAYYLFLFEKNWEYEGIELENSNQKMNLKRLPDTQFKPFKEFGELHPISLFYIIPKILLHVKLKVHVVFCWASQGTWQF